VFTAGISPAESPIVGRLVALRVYHPILAFLVGALLLLAAWTASRYRPDPWTKRLARTALILYGLQLLLGALDVALKAPVWLQMVHLLCSNLIWIATVLLAASAMAARPTEVTEWRTVPSGANARSADPA
jgi:heme A synthase